VKENNYKYFSNNKCEYFPCHKNAKGDFNCLFCYCPLYFLEDCGGNKKIFNGIKDCSDCLIPHGEHGYDHIVGRIVKENSKKKNI